MNGKSEILIERLLVIALIIIFILMFFLSFFSPHSHEKDFSDKAGLCRHEQPLTPFAATGAANPWAAVVSAAPAIPAFPAAPGISAATHTAQVAQAAQAAQNDTSQNPQEDEPLVPAAPTETDDSLTPAAVTEADEPLVPVAATGEKDPDGICEADADDIFPDTAAALPAPEVKTYFSGHAYGRNLRVNIAVKNNGDGPSSNIRLEIPLLAELESPYQETVKETFSREPLEIKRLANNNRLAVFQLDSLSPGASATITLEYFLNVYPLNLKQFTASANHSGPAPQNYLQPSEKIESNHPDIVKKARELTAACRTDFEKARAVCNFVTTYLKYDLNSNSRNGGALAALRNGSGVCEEYASLFAALCRASGIPARVVNGYCDARGTGECWNLSPGERFPLQGYRHSWVEFFLDGSGWIPADPTMDIHCGNMKYFGSLPQPSHLAQNYEDISLKVRYTGAGLSVTWTEELVGC